MVEKETSGETLRLRKTRKAFYLEYGCALVLIGTFFFSSQKALFPSGLTNSLSALALLTFLGIEISRLFQQYEITNTKITSTKGIFRRVKGHMYFQPSNFIPNITLKQNLFQKMLGYGSLFVQGEEGNHIEIEDVDRPHEVLHFIEKIFSSHPPRPSSNNKETL